MNILYCKAFDFSGHAIEQMFARKITVDDVKYVVNNGQKIASYPDDRPHPSFLIFHYIKDRPIHVVVAVDSESEVCIIVTAYEPSQQLWENDFKTRK